MSSPESSSSYYLVLVTWGFTIFWRFFWQFFFTSCLTNFLTIFWQKRRDDLKINRQVRNPLRRPWLHLSCIWFWFCISTQFSYLDLAVFPGWTYGYSLINMRQLQILLNQTKTWHRIVCWFSWIFLFLPVLAWCVHKIFFFWSAEQYYDHIMQELV